MKLLNKKGLLLGEKKFTYAEFLIINILVECRKKGNIAEMSVIQEILWNDITEHTNLALRQLLNKVRQKLLKHNLGYIKNVDKNGKKRRTGGGLIIELFDDFYNDDFKMEFVKKGW